MHLISFGVGGEIRGRAVISILGNHKRWQFAAGGSLRNFTLVNRN
jgi:hypothetical protein